LSCEERDSITEILGSLKRHVTAEFFRKAESEGRMLLEYHKRMLPP